MINFIFCLLFFAYNTVFAIDVLIQGNKNLSKEAIKDTAMFPDSDNEDEWNAVVKRLYNTGWFDKITVDVENQRAVLTVLEYPTLVAFKIESKIDNLKPDTIIEMLEEAGIRRGEPLTKQRIEQWRLSSVQELNRLGYEGASVDITIDDQEQGVILDICIAGGSLIYVHKINITGNPVFRTQDLQAVMDIYPEGFWTWWNGSNKFSTEKMKNAQLRLQEFYQDQGYFKPNISYTVSPVKKNKVDIQINIEAGKPAIIQDVQIVGDCKDLHEYILLQKGKIFFAQQMQKYMFNSGMIKEDSQARLQPRLLREDAVELVLICPPQVPLVIRNIEIAGEGTDDILISKLLDFDEGDEWRSSWISSSRRRLLGQAFIADANITLRPDPMVQGVTDVIVNVEESKKNSMASFRISYEQGGSGLGFGGGFSNKNFLSSGNSVAFDAQYSSVLWYTDLQLIQPIVPLKPSGIMGFSFRVTNQDKLDLGQYKQDVAAVNYGYRWLLTDQFLFQSQVSLKANHFILYNSNATYLVEELNKFGYNPNEFAWTNVLVRDNRDRAERTTSGSVSKLNINTVIPVFNNMMSYVQISPSYTNYTPLALLFNQPIVLRSNVLMGYGFSYGQYQGYLPFYNRYYAGGIGTVRGYYLYSLGPYYIDQYNNQRATGGNWLLVGNLDLLLPSPYPDFLQPSLFLDTGNVYLQGIHLNELRYSTGLSTAISTPFAELTVTFAKFINPGPEKYNTITIEIGRQF